MSRWWDDGDLLHYKENKDGVLIRALVLNRFHNGAIKSLYVYIAPERGIENKYLPRYGSVIKFCSVASASYHYEHIRLGIDFYVNSLSEKEREAALEKIWFPKKSLIEADKDFVTDHCPRSERTTFEVIEAISDLQLGRKIIKEEL